MSLWADCGESRLFRTIRRSSIVKQAYIRKEWLIEYESIKKSVLDRFGEEYFRNFNKIIARIAQHHYNKKGMLLGREREFYDFLLEQGHNPYKIYRWCLLERVPETIRFQLKNGLITQKTALSLHFKSKHETNSQACISIKIQGLNLVRSM